MTTHKPASRGAQAPLAFKLHSLFGLKLSLIIAFVCFTGSLATISHEIEWLYKPDVRASQAFSDVAWGQIWDNARRRFPDAELTGIGSYDRDDARYFAKQIAAIDQEGTAFNIYADPATASIKGYEYGRSFQDLMRALHYHLFTSNRVVMIAIAALGFLMLGSLITGLIFYKKFWRDFFRLPRFNRPAKVWISDLHRLGGIWSVWLLALISTTCIWYTLEFTGMNFNSAMPRVEGVLDKRAVTGNDIDSWVSAAQDAMPGLEVTAVFLPYSDGMPVIVQGNWQALLVRERANAAFIEPGTSAVLAVRDAAKMALGERLLHTVDPLHFGTYDGLALKILYAIFGLVLTGLALSGAYIYAKRVRTQFGPGYTLGTLNYLGLLKWPSVIVISVVPLVACFFWLS